MEHLSRQAEAEVVAEAIKQRYAKFESILCSLPGFGVSESFIHSLRTYGTMKILGADSELGIKLKTEADNRVIKQLQVGEERRLRKEQIAIRQQADVEYERRLRNKRVALQRLLKTRIKTLKQHREKRAALQQQSETEYKTEMVKTSDEDDCINTGCKFVESFEFSQ